MNINKIKQRLKVYKRVDITTDLRSLSENQKKIIENLIEAGKVADHIFWRQSSHDALQIRDQYKNQPGPLQDYIEINYGPYDRLNDFKRFVGDGPQIKPLGAGFYPEDLSRDEFTNYVRENSDTRDKLEDLYTVISRDEDLLKTEPYHQIYQTEVRQIAKNLENAADLTNNRSLKKYFELRSKALTSDQYYESDIAWMELKDNWIDMVIGPIENYEDRLFNYKTAYEAAVMIKDFSASEELAIYQNHIENLEKNLPIKIDPAKSIKDTDTILEIVNIAFFGGDYQAGVKTIAASLPNDERVISEKGAKKQLYKNIMEAKFDQILIPLADILINKKQRPFVSKERFISQVLLHEISHTIGPNYVINKAETVRKSLKEKYSIIEECKADILGIFSAPYFAEVFSYSTDEIAEQYVTYVAGLFRSIRFGVEEAHGLANLIQLNFLRMNKVIDYDARTNTYAVDTNRFFKVIKELTRIVLTIEAHGNYAEANNLIEKYGQLKSETSDSIERLNEIPTDLDLNFNPLL